MMAGNGAILNLGWAFTDRNGVFDLRNVGPF
jgi:hypothetical protein